MLYHIDFDFGTDDALAFVAADSLLSEQVIGISAVAGNVSLDKALRVASLLLPLLPKLAKIPLFRGAERASDGFQANAENVHGNDGLGGATTALSIRMESIRIERADPIGKIRKRSGSAEQITIVGLGPATNIPSLVELYGRESIARIVLMSGSFFDVGNIKPWAEFNAYYDPCALRATVDLGIPTTIIPLDLCRKLQISRDLALSWIAHNPSPLAALLSLSHIGYMDIYAGSEGIDGCFPHDAITVLATIFREKLFSIPGHIVVNSDEKRGYTELEMGSDGWVEVVTGGHLKVFREWFQSSSL